MLTIVALAARALAGGGASATPRAETAVSAGAKAPSAAVVAPADAHRPITSPSTFAMGVATLAALGLLHWRRRRLVAETAAL